MRTATDILGQLERAGLVPYLVGDTVPYDGENGASISGVLKLDAIEVLKADTERFVCGPLSFMHTEVGPHRVEFRAYKGVLGDGSLQVVINKDTGGFHADIDGYNIYQDGVNAAGHTFLEVLPYLAKKLWPFKRKKKT